MEKVSMKTATTKRLPKIELRLVRETRKDYQPVSIRTPSDAVRFLQYLAEKPEEHFIALHLNAKNEIIGLNEISHGTLSASLVHPREVFKAALVSNAHAILVAHNHPSGSKLAPSKEDLETTERLNQVAAVIGVPVIDHIIIGSNGDDYSIRENHPSLWASSSC